MTFETDTRPELEFLETYPEFEWGEEFGSPLFESETSAGRGALPASPQLRAAIQEHQDAHRKLMETVAKMRRHIAVRDGRLQFTLPARSAAEAAARLGVPQSLFSHLHKSMTISNTHAGRRRAMGTTAIRPASKMPARVDAELESGPLCRGVTKYEPAWYGPRLWLDECKTQALVNALKGGGAVGGPAIAASCVAATGGVATPACAALGALPAAAGFLIDAVDKWGGSQGVILTWTWVTVATPFTGILPIVTPQ